jgi:hypothetical protein
MMRAPSYSLHRNFLVVSFLVIVASAADDVQPGRWLSRRDFVIDTTSSSRNNYAKSETAGSELEFGQHRDLRIVHRKDNRAGKRSNEKEVKRKRKLKKVNETNHHHSQNNAHHNNQQGKHENDHYNNHHYRNEQKVTHHNQNNAHHNNQQGKHENDHYNNHHYRNEQKHTQNNDKRIDEINIDTDLMGHILRRSSEPKSLDYQGDKSKKPTRKPTKKPSKQPTVMPVSDTDGRTDNNFPTVSATQFPVASVADDTKEECSPNSICYQEGTVCSSGQEECCGIIHASLECECANVGGGNLQYMCFHTEACMLPCEDKASTDTTSTNEQSKPPTSSICPMNLRKSESLLDDLTLHYDVVGDNLCIRLEYDNEGWIGLGFSSSYGKMVGSTAVIGIPDVKEGTTNPAYYALDGMVESMITPLPESQQQTLQEATILQDQGLTVLTFAKSLIDDDHIGMGENTFIFAAANYNQFGYHDKRGSVTLYLSP